MAKAKKFGALSGVFVPSILTILGVIMYLRLPWIVGQAGLWSTIGIILVAHIISFSTGLSVSSIATDKKVETGGSYYIISRSMGLPIGGTLGIALFVGLSFSVSLYLIGFAEVFLGYFGFETTINNIRIAGTTALLTLTVITFISTSLAIKSQYIILTALALSLVSVLFGNFNFVPEQPLSTPMDGSLPWITLFAIFFPAVTGFEAGVSMSGDLKDPRKNIPLGTITAVLVGLTIYLGLTFFFSWFVERDLLVNDPTVLFKISWIPQLVVVGILGATLSSALGSILGAPRILQATAIDRITPSVLGKGFGASNEPRNALIFTFVIALSGILIGELNVIARIVTIFFIITYGFLNITYTIESWAGTDFRPSFRIPWFISIIGAITCVVVMIQLDIVAMIAASIILFGLFLFLKKKELTLQTGDTWNSVWASLVKTGLRRLSSGTRQTRNWRPNIIVFSGGAKQRPFLIEAAKSLVGKLGIFTNFELIESKEEKHLFSKIQQVKEEETPVSKGVYTRKYICRDVYEGIETIAKTYGFSGFEPNTILMGWPYHPKNPEGFELLVKKIKRLGYNQLFLAFNKESNFGKYEKIDIWWSGKGRNISFAITLIRFLLSSNKWRAARIRILMINKDSNLNEKYYDLLKQILENSRLQAEIKIINNSVERLPTLDIMRSESITTDLSIVEIDDKQEGFYTQGKIISEVLPTSLLISASGFFDDHSILDKSLDEKLTIPTDSLKPTFQVTNKLKLARKQIIANEVFNVAQKLENITSGFYQNGFENIKNQWLIHNDTLWSLVEKTTDQLQLACQTKEVKERNAEFLRIINDFSFKAHSILKEYREKTIVNHSKDLEQSSKNYFDQLSKALLDLPHFIRINYHWKDFRLLKADSLSTAILKLGKLLKARITSSEATYKIKVDRAARYFLYHKPLLLSHQLFKDFALYNFENIIAMRKILGSVYQLAEKGKNGSTSQDKLSEIIHLEKDRFKAAISLRSDATRNFIHNLGTTLESELFNDLQSFNNLLDRPASNYLSRPFTKAFRQDNILQEDVLEMPQVWLKNTSLFVNKIYLDFFLQSLKNRIEAKIRKYNNEYYTMLSADYLNPVSDLQKQLKELVDKDAFEKKPDRDIFKIPPPEKHYNRLFDEISILLTDLPDLTSISGEDLTRSMEEGKFQETTEIEVSVKKTVEFSIATELIDHARKHILETSLAFSKSLNRTKDYVRLLNFNLKDEVEEEQQSLQQNNRLADDFIEKLKSEAFFVTNVFNNFEKAILSGLKDAFGPLSSSVIAKTSGSIKKKLVQSRNQRFFDQVDFWRENLMTQIQKRIVGLVYSKSESILWMGKLENPSLQSELANEEVFQWLDSYAPKEEITSQLPFYYAKLFSGQSNIGEDFWVGMQQEISSTDIAVKRFKNGQPGCIIISGHRNAGKTSLSKYCARKHFEPSLIHNIRAPRECNADIDLFENSLLKSMNSNHEQLESALKEQQKPMVFIINDLELWWERKETGAAVVNRVLHLIKNYHRKILFIININIHSLKLVNRLTGIQSWALGVIFCTGFDARELHDLVLIRHKAGGMNFVLDKKHESNFTAWNYASLFNRYFDITDGNPGLAINLWLASIKKVNVKTLHMQKPVKQNDDFLHKLNKDQILLLLQFIYHLRLTIKQLSISLQVGEEEISNQILGLWQKGILVEKFPGIYAINSALEQPLVKIFTEMKLL